MSKPRPKSEVLADLLQKELAETRVERNALRAALADVDGVIDEYGIDTVGTGPRPSNKEQARVDAIVEAAVARHKERSGSAHEQRPQPSVESSWGAYHELW